MRIIVRSKEANLWLPVPLRLAGFAVKSMPESVFASMRKDVPEPYAQLITKANARIIIEECMDILKDNRGLEIIHVEAADGTFVSITI